MSDTPAFPHDWRMIQVTPMAQHDGGLLPSGPTEVNTGCFACNMGFDEGKDVNCPGQDLFEEESHDDRPHPHTRPRRRTSGD